MMLPSGLEQRRLPHAGLLAQGVQPGQHLLRAARRPAARPSESALRVELAQHVVQSRAAQAQATLERLLHAHVEPGLDALVQKLHRNRVHQRARQHRHQREQQHQPQRQLGAEQAGLQAPAQRQELIAHQHHQRQHDASTPRNNSSGRSRANIGVFELALNSRYSITAPSSRISAMRYFMPRDSRELRTVRIDGRHG